MALPSSLQLRASIIDSYVSIEQRGCTFEVSIHRLCVLMAEWTMQVSAVLVKVCESCLAQSIRGMKMATDGHRYIGWGLGKCWLNTRDSTIEGHPILSTVRYCSHFSPLSSALHSMQVLRINGYLCRCSRSCIVSLRSDRQLWLNKWMPQIEDSSLWLEALKILNSICFHHL